MVAALRGLLGQPGCCTSKATWTTPLTLRRCQQTHTDIKEVANITSAINRALHREGISDARADRVRFTVAGRILGVTTPTSTLQGLPKYRNMVLRAAWAVNSGTSDAVAQQKWK